MIAFLHLLVIHNMGKACNYCSLWADGFESVAPLIGDETSFVLVNGDSPEVQREVAATRGWTFPMVSEPGTEFTQDMGMITDDGRWPGVTAFFTRSSAANIPVNMNLARKLGLHEDTYSVTIPLGATSGTFRFSHEMFGIRDRIRILHDGLVLLDTGCVSGRATRMLSFSGLASFVSVEVLPNCSGTTSGTAWNYTLACPGS